MKVESIFKCNENMNDNEKDRQIINIIFTKKILDNIYRNFKKIIKKTVFDC